MRLSTEEGGLHAAARLVPCPGEDATLSWPEDIEPVDPNALYDALDAINIRWDRLHRARSLKRSARSDMNLMKIAH